MSRKWFNPEQIIVAYHQALGLSAFGFGDNAVNLEVRVWSNDPPNGIGSVKSDLFWGLWQRFRDHGIIMPYPQGEAVGRRTA